jgi:hypothetical protein
MPQRDQDDYTEKIEARLRAFAESSKPISKRGLDKESLELIVDLLAIKRNLDSEDPKVRAQLLQEAVEKMQKFDPDTPELTHAAKMLRLIAMGGGAADYLDGLEIFRKHEEGNRQRQRAKTVRHQSPFDELLLEFVRHNSDIGPKEVLNKLRGMRAIFPIYDVTEDYIFTYECEDYDVENPHPKKHAISGLGSRLSRLKKSFKSRV